MRKQRFLKASGLLALALLVMGAAGCGGKPEAGKTEGEAGKASDTSFDYSQAATLTMYNPTVSPDYYRDYVEPHIRKKFPNVKIEHINPSDPGNGLDSLIAAKKIPDIYLTTTTGIPALLERGLLADLEPVVKKHKIDLTVFEDPMLQSIRGISDKGELFGLPWTYGSTALFYNKEIFDRYGVAYPKSGMTWDSPELRDMVVKLNRPQDGIRGIMFNLGNMLGQNQLSLPFVDPKAEKALVQTEGFKRIIDTFAALYKAGGAVDPADFDASGQKAFITKRNVAIWAGNAVYPNLIDLEKKGNGFNWDIVSLPTFKEAPGIGTQYFGAVWAVSSANGNQEMAAHIISVLTSAEVQIEGGGLLRFPTLKEPAVKDSLGKGESFLQSKNMKALQINKIPAATKPTKYDSAASGILVSKAAEVIRDQKDSNTALREAAEEIDKKIAEIIGAK
ncbi:extracellular solute-binding protein [Paenibacillus mesophilus]|uniref:ABC transporter substrate-binding protein n=1 Tax=Paenibacillus mesophilus TaxID=2582849 RepID=UPI00110E096E|nr:extracellular solute-binding protein [Paenibacillus mesophilus]TMV52847.1 extracellular solute-binding protein [Paenibacillus mesophilus]